MYLNHNITFTYDRKPVLKEVSLTLERGEFLGLIGPNGSGKTTLLKVLSGILTPQSGFRTYRDRPLSSWPPLERARSIAYVPQENHFLYPHTVEEVVLMGRSPHTSLFGFDRPADLRIARESLERVELSHMAGRVIHTLSGGERQLVMIARALAQEPELLLLDEPTAYLDLSHQLRIFDLLRRLNRYERLTLIASSHDLNLAAQYCGRLIVLDGGRLEADGEPGKVLNESLIERIYGCRTLVDSHPITGRPRITLVPEGEN